MIYLILITIGCWMNVIKLYFYDVLIHSLKNSDYVLNKNIFDNSPLIIYLFYNKDKLNNSFFRDEKFRIILEKYGYTFDNELKIAKSRNKHILINGMAGTGKTTLMDREAASGNLLIKLSHGEKGTGSTIFQVLKYALEYKIGKENEDFIKFIFYMKLLYHPEDIKERTELYKLFKDYYTYKDFEVIINDVYVFDKYKETPKFRWYRLSKNYVTKTIDYTFIGSILYEVEIKDIYTNFIEKMLVDKEDYDSIKDTGEFLLCLLKLILKIKQN